MGIEAMGSAIGTIAFEAAPAGGLASFGPKFEGPLTSIVNEGPVSLIDFKNTMPLQLGQINPVSELRFNEPDVIKEAEYWLGVIKPAVEPKPLGIVQPHIQTVVEQAEAVAQKAWEAHPITQAEQIIQESDKLMPAVLPVTSERMEEIEMEQRAYLEDEEASAQRKYEIREAIAKARIEADRLGLKKIAGWLVAKFLPSEHQGNRSQVVKKTGPDGSYQETVETIAGTGDFESEGKAVERFDEIVLEKKPIKYGKAGTPVANQDVARVFKYHLFKPAQPHLEVIKRVVKKKVQQPVQQSVVSTLPQPEKHKTESNITDFPILAGAFEKAA